MPQRHSINFACSIKLAVLLAMTLVASCGGGGGGDGGGDSGGNLSQNACGTIGLNPKIIDGTQCTGLSASPVVRIVSDFSNGTQEICSGTMITSNTVLTAVHCFIDFVDANNELIGSDVVYGDATNLSSVSVPNIDISPLLRVQTIGNEQILFNDFAVLTLARNLPLPTLPLLTSRAPVVGDVAQIFGYGRTTTGGSDVASDNIGLFSGESEVQLVTNNHIRVTFLSGGSGTCFGDSGGPLVITINGQAAIVGVLSQFVDTANGGTDCSVGSTSQYTNLQSSELLSSILQAVPRAGTI